jgi:glycerol uptake facilitator-like aquaporin
MCIGPLTGGAFNPARALGPALAGDFFGGFGRWFVIYVLGPITGALIAGLVYEYVILRDVAVETDPQEMFNE